MSALMLIRVLVREPSIAELLTRLEWARLREQGVLVWCAAEAQA